MTKTKLILIEGLPGSGKTTTAQFVAEWLGEHGVETAVFLEGNLDHPADFESIACLDAAEYAALKAQFPTEAEFLANQVICEGEDYFFRYHYLQKDHPRLSALLLTELARYEIYELAAEKYQRLVLRRWRRFATAAKAENITYIFECCFLQNPLTMLLGRHDEPVSLAKRFILNLASAIQSLAPCLLYLDRGDVRQTLTQIAQSRPQSWLEFVIAYHTQQGHGQAQCWHGFDGLVNFYQMRQTIELALLPQLPFPNLLVNHTDWAYDQARVADFLTPVFSP